MSRRRPSRGLLAAATTALLACGCFAPSIDARTAPDGSLVPPVELFARDASGADAGAPCPVVVPTPLTTARLTVRTSAFGGRFAPRNVGAIWLLDADGAFIRTLERWGEVRARWLLRFQAETGADVLDAVTSATLTSHRVHELEWRWADRRGCPLGARDAQLALELTDRSGAGATVTHAFSVGAEPMALDLASSETFHDLRLVLE